MGISATCRRCGSILSPSSSVGEVGAGKATHVLRRTLPGVDCGTCGWPNVSPETRRVKLADAVERWIARDDALRLRRLDETDSAVVHYHLENLRSSTLRELMSLVQRDSAMGLDLLLRNLNMVSRDPSTEMDSLALMMQVIYACLLVDGPLDVFQANSTGTKNPEDLVWFRRAVDLAQGAVHLSDLCRDAIPGTVDGIELHGGVLTLPLPPQHAVAHEVIVYGIGRHHDEASYGESTLLTLAPYADAVEQRLYGTSITELIEVLLGALEGSSSVLSAVTRVRTEGALLLVDLRVAERVHPLVRLLRELIVLNSHYWRLRQVPSFFFADARTAARNDEDLVRTASEIDWLRYAPVLCGAYVGDGDLHVVGVTTYGLLWRSLQRARGAMSSRLHLAERAALKFKPEAVSDIRRLSRTVHAQFEKSTAEACKAGGMSTFHSIERLFGKQLPCGEIDLVARMETAHGDLVIVGECKNIDLIFYKDPGVVQQALAIAEQAGGQAARKASWVLSNWAAIAGELSWPIHRPSVLAVVVTRLAALPTLGSGIPVVPLAELPEFLQMLRGATECWWPALRRQGTWGHTC
jgi:hypothetical protein